MSRPVQRENDKGQGPFSAEYPALGQALRLYTFDQGTADLWYLGHPCRVRRPRRLNFLVSEIATLI